MAQYRVEILHYLNPHLIWIKKVDPRKVVLEQVGLFGILPLVATITDDGKVLVELAEQWMPVVRKTIENFRQITTDVYFEPIHIDRRGSIFNNGIHNFGEIYGFTENRKRVSLSGTLVQCGYARRDECLFYQQLTSGNIKTKLDTVTTEQVINSIEKHLDDSEETQKCLQKKTSMFRSCKEISSTLTAKNLELHNRNSENVDKIDMFRVMEDKTNDLNLRKYDDDDIPIGRGMRKLKDVEKTSSVTNTSTEVSLKSDLLRKRLQQISTKTTPKIYLDVNKNEDSSWNEEEKTVKLNFKEAQNNDYYEEFQQTKDDFKSSPKWTKSPNKKPPLKQVPKKLDKNQRLIAFGPPMSQWTYYNIQVAKDDDDEVQTTRNRQQNDEEPKWDEDGQVDSDIDIKITNIDSLKRITRNDSSTSNDITVSDRKPSVDVAKNCINVLKDRTVNVSNSSKDIATTNNNIVKDIKAKAIGIDNSLTKSPTDVIVQSKVDKSRVQEKTQVKVERKMPLSLQNRLKMLKEKFKNVNDLPKLDKSDTNTVSKESSDDEIEVIKEQLKSEYAPIQNNIITPKIQPAIIEKNPNPFKNLDGSKSVFVEKLVSPTLMVHTKNDNLVLPQTNIRDINFKTGIKIGLKNMKVKVVSRLQSVCWPYILRGHSVFMIGPLGSGKTLGYVPAICNLAIDYNHEIDSVGPIVIIVCATTKSVADVAKLCRYFVGDKVLACFNGLDTMSLFASVLNGCDILVATPPMLYRLLNAELGVDLRRLTTVVFDDCERLSEVYMSEIKTFKSHIKEMLKQRADKKIKVQYVVASRKWCDFMTPLAKKAPDTIVAISAFQECVLYSKAQTTVKFVLKDKKIDSVMDFMNDIDQSKRTVIVCRENDEVELLNNALDKRGFKVFACDNNMDIHELYNMTVAWSAHEESTGPILVCCDGNLTHLNVTNANHLIHFSMPETFSLFCIRFAVLNDNYASIFGQRKEDIKIQVLLEENNVEQLPKILNFVKRCTSEIPEPLDEISRQVLELKDLNKAEKFVPICDNLLMLSVCPDIWSCQQRHAILKDYDEPKAWVPTDGVITFQILHYDNAVTYSARLLSRVTKFGTTRYPKTYSTLSLKMGLYYSQDKNKRLHGVPKLGDVCAVSLKQNFFSRCRVIKIVSYFKNNPHHVLVHLIDEEQLQTVKDVDLYYLPEDLKAIETHVVKVRLANIQPQDKDVTYSEIANKLLKDVTDRDDQIFMRGNVVLTVGKNIFIDTLEACQDLVALNETVVKRDFKKELLETHATLNTEHVNKLKELSELGGLVFEKQDDNVRTIPSTYKLPVKPRWAYLPHQMINVALTTALSPGKFFVCLPKFQQCIDSLMHDVKKYLSDEPKALGSVNVGDIVLAEYPDDKVYERARIEKIVDKEKVICFFVDTGDEREVASVNLKHIPDNLIEQLPFQAIECKLVGLKPPHTEWSEFSINWFTDKCYEENGKAKQLYAKYFVKEKAEFTGGHCYGIVLIDTYGHTDENINKMMIDLNLAKEDEQESGYLDEPINIEFKRDSSDDEIEVISNKKDLVQVPIKEIKNDVSNSKKETSDEVVAEERVSLRNVFQKPLRSVPLVNDDVEINECDVNMDADFLKAMGLTNLVGAMAQRNVSSDENLSKPPNTLPMIANEPENTEQYEINLKNNVSSSESCDEIDAIENKTKDDLAESVTDDKSSIENGRASNTVEINKTETDSDDLSDTDFENRRCETPKELDDPKIVIETENVTVSPKSNLFALQAKTQKELKYKQEDSKDSDDLSSTDVSIDKSYVKIAQVNKRPKLVWRQNKATVTIKIQLIGVETYSLKILDRAIDFNSYHNDENYAFKIDLYGVIDTKKSSHSNKGQYIQVNLRKILTKNWLSLCKDSRVAKWIVYDVDCIDTSSDEEEVQNLEALNALKQNLKQNESDSDDYDFVDDIDFKHKRHYI